MTRMTRDEMRHAIAGPVAVGGGEIVSVDRDGRALGLAAASAVCRSGSKPRPVFRSARASSSPSRPARTTVPGFASSVISASGSSSNVRRKLAKRVSSASRGRSEGVPPPK
mgnify:CR=1 FL=1